MKMNSILMFLLLFCVLGCQSRLVPVALNDQQVNSSPSMHHTIDVPKQYCGGQNIRGAMSSIERYIDAHEQCWWRCIENYANNIHYRSADHDWAFNGWPAAIAGAEDGYKQAEQLIQQNIEIFGPDKTLAHLRQLMYGGE